MHCFFKYFLFMVFINTIQCQEYSCGNYNTHGSNCINKGTQLISLNVNLGECFRFLPSYCNNGLFLWNYDNRNQYIDDSYIWKVVDKAPNSCIGKDLKTYINNVEVVCKNVS